MNREGEREELESKGVAVVIAVSASSAASNTISGPRRPCAPPRPALVLVAADPPPLTPKTARRGGGGEVGEHDQVLYDNVMRFNPKNAYWFNRGRFVLSTSHGCMLHYALLHLTGNDSVKVTCLHPLPTQPIYLTG
uniref:Transketolase N-terminal domain-containing protein n=1 Tax=Ananas comosus var. bracteatus TaxID=296719 RepID=A0A6V7PUB6_ANACO|nr:unnamed protein product [Ananas comosus var. bracteatus]